MKTIIRIALIFLCSSNTFADWPGFRGTGDSHTSLTDLPTKWADTENIAWRSTLAGDGQSSPVIAGDLVFVTSTGGSHKEHLYLEAYTFSDGAQKWKVEFEATQTAAEVTDMISRGAPTPAADEKGVYVFFESGDLFGLDHTGNIQWERRLVTEFGKFIGGHGIGTSLVGTPDSIVIAIDHDGPSYIMSVSKQTGATIWKTERTSRVSWSTPLYTKYDGVEQIIVSSNGSVDSYDLKTGQQIWTVTGINNNTVASPTVCDDLVVIGSSNPNDCLAIRMGGSGDVTDTHLVWRAASVTSSFGSPLFHKGLVYFVNRAGVLQAVRLNDGSLAWQHRLPASTWASPLAAGDRIYCFGTDGRTAVLTPQPDGPGEEIQINEVAVVEKDRVYGFAVAPGKIVTRTGREIVCIGK